MALPLSRPRQRFSFWASSSFRHGTLSSYTGIFGLMAAPRFPPSSVIAAALGRRSPAGTQCKPSAARFCDTRRSAKCYTNVGLGQLWMFTPHVRMQKRSSEVLAVRTPLPVPQVSVRVLARVMLEQCAYPSAPGHRGALAFQNEASLVTVPALRRNETPKTKLAELGRS